MKLSQLWRIAVPLVSVLCLTACDSLEDRFVNRPPGEKLYRRLCTDCHGVDGRGNTPKGIGNAFCDLTDGNWKFGGDEGSIAMIIRQGEFGEMPAHPELTNEQVRQLVDHILKLRRQAGTS
ncbi:MAG: c-type cytochrome [Acidobacteriota bacterium]